MSDSYRAKRALQISPSGFVLDGGTGESFSINKTGAVILSTFVEGRSLDDAVQALATEYELPLPAARRDTMRFVTELARMGLLVPREAPDA